MWLLIFNRLKENVEIAEKIMHVGGKSECIAWPINVDALYQMCNSMIEHVEDSECSLSRMVLESKVSYRYDI